MRFQSLSGFQVRCNDAQSDAGSCTEDCFNPYRVFKFVATDCVLVVAKSQYYVSIPIGFSSSLQLPNCQRPVQNYKSFNPYRVFKFVATGTQLVGKVGIDQFQSLSGFQVRCNGMGAANVLPQYNQFQSLSGFQVRCNIHTPNKTSFRSRFQSLSGFQVRCNAGKHLMTCSMKRSFNPYRVFKFVATSKSIYQH